MRLWTLHPHYLDTECLQKLWRDGLLAQKDLIELKEEIDIPPQLLRFYKSETPVKAVGRYLLHVYEEAEHREIKFSSNKIINPCRDLFLFESTGQIQYEWWHLLTQLKERAPEKYNKLQMIQNPDAHPMFKIVPGNVQRWELSSEG